jgi:hypothetical protein
MILLTANADGADGVLVSTRLVRTDPVTGARTYRFEKANGSWEEMTEAIKPACRETQDAD